MKSAYDSGRVNGWTSKVYTSEVHLTGSTKDPITVNVHEL